MAASCVETQEMNSHLLSSSGLISMKPPLKSGINTPGISNIPLAINTKGSLIELAHKLKWAYKNFCPKDEKSEEEDGFSVCDPWQNGTKPRPVLDPDHYIIQGLHSDSRPHPLLAYGDSLFQNAVPGQQYSYTSLGTVHDYNGSVSSAVNGYLPLSSALAMNQMIQQRTDLMEVEHEHKVDAAKRESCMETSVESLPDSKDELMQRFLTEHSDILTLKPSMNGVVGPSLWSLLTATKEVRELDHNKLIQSFKIAKSAKDVLGERLRLNNQDDANHGNKQNEKSVDQSSNKKDNLKHVTSFENNGSANLSNESTQDSTDKEGNCDNSGTQSDSTDQECAQLLLPATPAAIRDRLIVPLSEFEVSAICSSAVDFVVKHKTPARVLNQLAAMQMQNGKNPNGSHFISQRFDRMHASDGLRKYKCPKCMYQTDNKSHLRRHVSSVHFIGMPYYCYICHKEFPRSEKVKAHFMKLHPDVEYDHRLVRKDNYFGVDYSPEAMKSSQDDSQKRATSIKLTPTNMRTAGTCSARSRSRLFTSSLHPNHNLLAQALSAVATNVVCEVSGENKPVWRSPVKSEAGEKKYYCPQCPYTGKDIWHLKRHVNDVHQQLKDLKCPLCNYSTGRKHRLVSHMKNHGQLFCFHCDFSTENLVIFQSHVKACSLASRRAQHKCSRCDRACTNRKQLQDHQYKEHGIVMFCCSKCMFYSESDEKYKEHLQQHKDQHAGYVCQICNEVLHDYRSLRSHLSSHKQSPTSSASISTGDKLNKSSEKKTQDKLKCPSCPFECYYYHIMKEHKLVHTDNFLKCDISDCEFTTVWPLTMEHHKKSHHVSPPAGSLEKTSLELGPKGKGTFICPVCQDNRPPFRYKRSFDKHMAQHKEDEEKCPLCPQVFYFRASLKQHLKQDHRAHVIEVSSSDDESSENSDDSDSDKDQLQESVSSLQQDVSSSFRVQPSGPQLHLGSPTSQSPGQDRVARHSSADADVLMQSAIEHSTHIDSYSSGSELHGSTAPYV